MRANRAGTRGFRAPEVLLKCPDQTVGELLLNQSYQCQYYTDIATALDIWSVGIMMLCFLTRRFPFFNSNDDTEALVEIAAIFGRKRMERCAAVHSKAFDSSPALLTNSKSFRSNFCFQYTFFRTSTTCQSSCSSQISQSTNRSREFTKSIWSNSFDR